MPLQGGVVGIGTGSQRFVDAHRDDARLIAHDRGGHDVEEQLPLARDVARVGAGVVRKRLGLFGQGAREGGASVEPCLKLRDERDVPLYQLLVLRRQPPMVAQAHVVFVDLVDEELVTLRGAVHRHPGRFDAGEHVVPSVERIGARLEVLHRSPGHAHIRIGDGIVHPLGDVQISLPRLGGIELGGVGEHLVDRADVGQAVGVARGRARAGRVVAQDSAVVVIDRGQEVEPSNEGELAQEGIQRGPEDARDPIGGLEVGQWRLGVRPAPQRLVQQRRAIGLVPRVDGVVELIAIARHRRVPGVDELRAERLHHDESFGCGRSERLLAGHRLQERQGHDGATGAEEEVASRDGSHWAPTLRVWKLG